MVTWKSQMPEFKENLGLCGHPHLKTGSYSLPWKQSKPDTDTEPLQPTLVAQMVKKLNYNVVQSLGQEDPPEKGMATYSSHGNGEIHGQRSLPGSTASKESGATNNTEPLHQALIPPPSSAVAKKCYFALLREVPNAFLKILIFLLSFTFSRKFSWGAFRFFVCCLFFFGHAT